MQKHERFEELSALAAIGQLTQSEQQELVEHLSVCHECRETSSDFSSVLTALPAIEETQCLDDLRKAEAEAYRKRFLERARGEGREFSTAVLQGGAGQAPNWRIFPLATIPRWAYAAPAALLLAVGCGYFAFHEYAKSSDAKLHSLAPISTPVRVTVSVPPQSNAVDFTQANLQKASAAADEKVALLESENQALQQKSQEQDRDLRMTQAERQEVSAALTRADELNAKLGEQAKENETLLVQTRTQLEKEAAERSQTSASLAMERRTVDDLSTRLSAQNVGLDREKDLLAEGRDIRDLMGARNLHIIDVFDSDAKGKNRRSFGRVFYTEGKSLIFYAFDLDHGRAVDATYSFEAWGEELGQPSSVKNLGVFYADDNAQKRWVLKLEDPAQIAQINSVFVTLEPNGANVAPHGKKILYAFLGGGANHP